MQSHLEAALLGHLSSNVVTTPNLDDDDNKFYDEVDDIEDCTEEELEGDTNTVLGKQFTGSPRNITLQMLLSANILEPAKGSMTIEYLGQKFVGDLLEDGKIKSQETDIVFASPSAWAIACKRFINPDKKSGCGWASIKYCGRKLDVYKNLWYKKLKEERSQGVAAQFGTLLQKQSLLSAMQYQRMVVKHNTIANRTLTHDANTLIDCVPFSNIGKIQPFLITLSTNAVLLMDFHCHLMKTEVCGYLAGHWDFNIHTLTITHAFPCRYSKSDKENIQQIERNISKSIEKQKLTLVGWYHSHPYIAANPTLRDIDAQLDYQIRMKGSSENNYTPSPYNFETNSLESSIVAYWVIPPPEAKPNEYGRPMLMTYSVKQDTTMTSHVQEEMQKCVGYYKKQMNFVNFSDRYLNNNLFIDKLKSTLLLKFPRDDNETNLWRFIKETLGYQTEENECLLSIPSIPKSPILPNLNSNLMLQTDLANAILNPGKYSRSNPLLGFSDPLSYNNLASNNFFLSSNLFKMQELLKPLSTSSPISTKTKIDQKLPATDVKSKTDPSSDLLNLKNKLNFFTPDLSLSKIDSSLESSGNHSKSTDIQDVASLYETVEQHSESPKIPKLDFDKSQSSTFKNIHDLRECVTDINFSLGQKTESTDDTPLNLTFDHQ